MADQGIRMVMGRLKGKDTMTVQTVIFAKDQWTVEDARAWLKDHEMRSDKVDETEDSYRFRQRDPGDFEDGSFRTITPGGKGVARRAIRHADARIIREGEPPRNALSFQLKSLTDEGVFEGLAAVYGVQDLQGDIIERGAFARTLDHAKGQTKILWQHDPSRPIGTGVLTDTPEGLKVTGTLALGMAAAREAYEALKAGLVDGLSIGYSVIKEAWERNVRILKELRLMEVSLVTFPAQLLATVTAVKQDLEPIQAQLQALSAEDLLYLQGFIEALLVADSEPSAPAPGPQDQPDSGMMAASVLAQAKALAERMKADLAHMRH